MPKLKICSNIIFTSLILVGCVLLTVSSASSAHGQNVNTGNDDLVAYDPDNTYLNLTTNNLIHLYWALNIIPISQDDKVDNYMRITECDIYEGYYHNDIQCHDIRKAARKKLQKIQQTFPTKIQFVLPIQVERYDTEEQHFKLTDDTLFFKARRIPVTTPQKKSTQFCGVRFKEFTEYPNNLVLSLNRAVHIMEIEMPPEDAEKLLNNDEFISSDRTLYLRFFVDLQRFKGKDKKGIKSFNYVSANVDKIELFRDPMLVHKIMDIKNYDQKMKVKESFK